MSFFTFFIFIFFLLLSISSKKKKNIFEYINSINTTWKANLNTIPSQFKNLLGVPLNYKSLPSIKSSLTSHKILNLTLPSKFDLRSEYSNCSSISKVYDQANCGSCWAVASASTISDRICINSNGLKTPLISSTILTCCCLTCGSGCEGGYPLNAFKWWKTVGLPTGGDFNDTNTCSPYFLPPCDHGGINGTHGKCGEVVDTPKCSLKCIDSYNKTYDEDKFYGKDVYSISGEEDLMKEIYVNGSVTASFLVYEDFVGYKEGVYKHEIGELLGAHAVRIVGWGEDDDGVKYWIVANSWNDEWGDKGMFKILKGNNECDIEYMACSGMPVNYEKE